MVRFWTPLLVHGSKLRAVLLAPVLLFKNMSTSYWLPFECHPLFQSCNSRCKQSESSAVPNTEQTAFGAEGIRKGGSIKASQFG